MRLLAIAFAAAALWGCAPGAPALDPPPSATLPTATLGYPTTRLTLALAPDAAGYRTASIAGITGNVKISVDGADLTAPVSAVSTASLQSGLLVIENAPAGKKRVITLSVLESDGTTPTPIAMRVVADLAAGSQTLDVSPRTTAVGGVFARLLATGPGKQVYATVDPVEIGTLIDRIKTFGARSPHYALIDSAAIADAVADRAGSLPDPSAAFQIAPGSVRITTAGAPENALTHIVVDDPVSPKGTGLSRLTTLTGDVYEIAPVMPGTWKVSIQVGTSLSAATTVTVAPGQTATRSVDFNDQIGWRPGPPLPAPLGAVGVAVLGTKIFAIGGVAPGGRATDSAFVLDTGAATPSWQRLPNLTFAREGAGAGVVGDTLVAAGGQTVDAAGSKTRLSSVERYSPILDKWVAGTDLPAAFMAGSSKAIWWGSIASANSATKIFAFQGIADFGINFAAGADYNPFSDKWDATTSPTPLTPRMMAAAAFLDSRVYLVGGLKPANPTFNQTATTQVPLAARAEVEYLDLTQNPRVWRAAPPLQVGRSEPAAAASPTRLFVAGGVGPGDRALGSVEVFDPATGKWSYMPSLRLARSSAGLAFAGGRLWAIGGAPSRSLGFSGGGSVIATDSVEALALGDTL